MPSLAPALKRPLLLQSTMLAAAGLLAACTVGPNFKAPPPVTGSTGYLPSGEAMPAALASGVSSIVAPRWWRGFGSPTLDQVVDQALAVSPTIEQAQATLAEARQSLAAATGAEYPQADFGANAGRQKLGEASLGSQKQPAFTYFDLGPSVSYALDVFGGTRREIERQGALVDARRYQLDAARLTLTGNVLTQAFNSASAQAQIKAVGDIIADDQRNLDLVKAERAAGSVSDVDVLSAESQLANDRTLLPPLRQNLSQARHALAILAGKAPVDWAAPDFRLADFTQPGLPLSVPSELARERPDIMVSEAQLHAASAAVGVATANLYPHITLTADVAQQAADPGHLFQPAATAWGLAAGLTAPIFHGGTLRADQQAAVDAYKASLAGYRQTVLTAFGQVADVLQALVHDDEQLTDQKRALDSATASLDLTRKSYQAGNVGFLQVLDAERLTEQARLGYVRAQAQRLQDTAQLYLALGGAEITQPPAAMAAAAGTTGN